jgi:hypothetical protein
MKTCVRCQETTPLSDYHRQSSKPDGYRSVCKHCRQSDSATYYNQNREIVKQRWKDYRDTHPDYNRQYYLSNSQYFTTYRNKHAGRYKVWRKKNRRHLAFYRKELKIRDPNFKVACSLRSYISTLIRNAGGNKTLKSVELLGCSIEQFRQHLEQQFVDGMGWDNYGEWHIDHIIPCSSFNLSILEEQKKCFHYTNTQPLWKIDNLRKGNRV